MLTVPWRSPNHRQPAPTVATASLPVGEVFSSSSRPTRARWRMLAQPVAVEPFGRVEAFFHRR